MSALNFLLIYITNYSYYCYCYWYGDNNSLQFFSEVRKICDKPHIPDAHDHCRIQSPSYARLDQGLWRDPKPEAEKPVSS